MAFLRRRSAAAHQIGLELAIVGNQVCANVRGPLNGRRTLRLERVPLRQAIVVAVRLASQCQADVAVIDRHGVWPG